MGLGTLLKGIFETNNAVLGNFFKLAISGTIQAEVMENQPKQNEQPTSSAPPIQKSEEGQAVNTAMGLKESLEKRYLKVKEHAETYPYVWASYIVVYGGFALWTTYRWRKLRKTEDRVRALQERLRKKQAEAEESSSSTKVIEKGPSDKPSK
ncbi:unnamed protein product [Sphenostylis stenocarpa]|uniref:Uncharacterized protein n=1 Tax=Sphenostylis stenocarpa TaxID=92480 RepID=A0AA86V124_9FABA|nr:unnamed protein product [Sphenostylis stenocarpa]